MQQTIVTDYANDKVIMVINKVPLIASSNLQLHLNLISEWCENWLVKINQNKSIHTTITLNHDVYPNITFNYVLIPTSDKVRYLD